MHERLVLRKEHGTTQLRPVEQSVVEMLERSSYLWKRRQKEINHVNIGHRSSPCRVDIEDRVDG